MSYHGPGVYRHYKGGEYDVLGLAIREETIRKPDEPPYVCKACGRGYEEGEKAAKVCAEADRIVFGCRLVANKSTTGKTVVVYRPLTSGSMLEKREEEFWTRPLDDFNASVRIKTHGDGAVHRPRFEMICGRS